MIHLIEIAGTKGTVYMSKDGCNSVELQDSAMWGYFEWGIMIDAAFNIETLCERMA